MNKEEWFQNFERIRAEREDLSDERVAELAREAQQDRFSTLADIIRDEAKHGERRDA